MRGVRPQNMVISHIPPVPCRAAVCREALADRNEWSVYLLNDLPCTIDVIVEHIDYEWGDLGHSQRPGTRFTLPPAGIARVCRVDDDDAELSMTISLLITAHAKNCRAAFELGKLYHYRDPMPIEALGMAGWLRSPDDCRFF